MFDVVKNATPEVKTDAKDRSFRTALQGLVALLVVNVVPVVNAAVEGGLDKVNWEMVGYSAGTAAVVTVLSWLMRFYSNPVE